MSIHLEPWAEDDLPLLQALLGDPAMMEHLGGPETPEKIVERHGRYLGYPGALLPWLYPLYYVLLLVPRQLDDDRRCAEKYGALWDEYRRAVPYRIVPWLY